MSDYTKINLKQVEDMAPQFGIADAAQTRPARVALELEKVGLSHFALTPNFRLPFGHKHVDQEEVYLLVTGTARIKIGDDIVDLQPWDAVRVPGPVMRNLEAGPEGAEIIAFGQSAVGEDQSTVEPGWWS
jgi:mannose-6-phosphate isomerase-like protein (cupin superfamily)